MIMKQFPFTGICFTLCAVIIMALSGCKPSSPGGVSESDISVSESEVRTEEPEAAGRDEEATSPDEKAAFNDPQESVQGLGVTLGELLSKPGNGFLLFQFDGKRVNEVPLEVLSQSGDQLIVGLKSQATPRFTFRIKEDPDFLSIHLLKKEGDFAGQDIGLALRVRPETPMESLRLDYMARDSSSGSQLLLSWPFLWNENSGDPLGSFAIFRKAEGAERDQSLAAIWAEGTMPHPDVDGPWTKERALAWVDEFHHKFVGLSETILTAKSKEDLYKLTDWLHGVGIRRVYLHTDTWRGEYWPRERSFVDVNPAVFPGGREDLVAYGDYLESKGMLLRLHSVSGGIGRQDPEFVLAETVHPQLATWVHGRLEQPVGPDDAEILFRPEPGSEIPSLKLTHIWRILNFRIGGEVVQAAEILNVDQDVWLLKGVKRGFDGTPAVSHDTGAEIAGLLAAYGQNYVPDNDSPLIEEIAARYANIINEAGLSHQHYDGREIHDHLQPWGFDKFNFLVSQKLKHPITSSTSGGRPSPWNFEYQFSKNLELDELGYWPLHIPLLLDEHRNATSWLDANYEMASSIVLSARRLGFTKPEPMFGVTSEIKDNHGLLPKLESFLADWKKAIDHIGDREKSWLLSMLHRVPKDRIRQRGNHYQSYDVPVLENRDGTFYLVPTRVMLREGLDAPWLKGQEFGPVGPRQYIQPNQTITLENPHAAQQPDLILRILPALSGSGASGSSAGQKTEGKTEQKNHLADYRTGTDNVDPEVANVRSGSGGHVEFWPSPKQAITGTGATRLEVEKDKLVLTANNPTSSDYWQETELPAWKVNVPAKGRRGIAIDVVGDGSGAVLVFQPQQRGKIRDYVIKLDFTGPRRVVIPNGEASWSLACWGWRFAAHSFDPQGTFTQAGIGFGYIPPNTSVRAEVTGIQLLDNLPGKLVNPIIRVGSGELQITGSAEDGEYLTYSPAEGVRIFDKNWNFLRALKSEEVNWMVPRGKVDVSIENEADGPQPWLELQLITRGEPFSLSPESTTAPGAQ
jgi:hypothetical protein